MVVDKVSTTYSQYHLRRVYKANPEQIADVVIDNLSEFENKMTVDIEEKIQVKVPGINNAMMMDSEETVINNASSPPSQS
jgi:hypothetical protein